MTKKQSKPKPISDIDLCKKLEKRNDPEINTLIMYFRDTKKAYMCCLNDKSRLADKLDRLTVEFNKIQKRLSEIWVKDSLFQKENPNNEPKTQK